MPKMDVHVQLIKKELLIAKERKRNFIICSQNTRDFSHEMNDEDTIYTARFHIQSIVL